MAERLSKNGKPLGAPKGRAHKYPKKRKSAAPTSTSFGQLINMEPGDNTRITMNALEIAWLPKIDLNDPVAVENRVIEYFQIVAKNDLKPTIQGLAVALDMDRFSLRRWVNGTNRAGQPQSVVAKKAYEVINLMWEDYMMNGKVNPVSGIFLGKNNFGYADKQELDISSKPDAVREGKTDAELVQIYDTTIEG